MDALCSVMLVADIAFLITMILDGYDNGEGEK